jgi:hypothetical protein
MRIFVMLGALAAVTLIDVKPGLAYYEGPWCLSASIGRDSTIDICHFRTFEQCRDERVLYGSTAFCVKNSRYLPYWTTQGEPQPRKSRQEHR